MSRSRVSCRSCGADLGAINSPSGVLHSGAVQAVALDRDALLVTLHCPACGYTFTVRAHRLAMTERAA